MIAEILESIEIKRLWPTFNKSQKHYEHKFAIYQFTDAKGYLRLCIDKKRNHLQPIMQFNLLTQAYNLLWQWVNHFQLHPALCFLDQSQKHLLNLPPAHTHNLAIEAAVQHHLQNQQSYLLHANNHFYILVHKGIFKGMGYLNTQLPQWNLLSTILTQITLYPDNSIIQGLLIRFEQQNPQQIFPIIDDSTATR